MRSDRWLTKADVLKDLRKATGRTVRNVDPSCFVVGERPPPQVHFGNEDYEMRLLSAKSMDKQDIRYEVMKPDLKGITKLIRMKYLIENWRLDLIRIEAAIRANSFQVQNHDNTDEESDKVSTDHDNSPCKLFTISKLNPNVQEFVPKSTSTSQSVHEKAETVHIIGSNSVNNKLTNVSNEVDAVHDKAKLNKTNSSINNGGKEVVNLNTTINKLDTANLKPNEIKVIATELKNKIVSNDKSKANTFEMKRERNVAIANLQKLYSKPLAENNPITVKYVQKPLKLITPEYYEKCKATDVPKENKSLEKDKKITANPVPLTSNCKDFSALAKYSSNTISTVTNENSEAWLNKTTVPLTSNCKDFSASAKCSSNTISPVTNVNTKTCLDKTISLVAGMQNKNIAALKKDQNTTGKTCTSDPDIQNTFINADKSAKLNLSDPQMQDSIKKVNNWLYKADIKSKAPPVCLNPVPFKRKDTANCNLPNGSITTKIAKPSYGVTAEYKPSEYADELMKKYTERATKNEKQKLTWANLDAVLKEKDGQIRARAGNRSGDGSASDMNVSDDSSTKAD